MQSKSIFTLFLIFFVLTINSPVYSQNAPSAESKQTVSKYSKVELQITGMSCQKGCADGIDKKLKSTPGISKSKTSFEKSKSVITYDPNKISVAEIINIIGEMGYTAKLVSK